MGTAYPVYLVDDEAVLRKVIRNALGARYQVIPVDSAEAFQRAAPRQPYLLIVDKNLPGMSGLDLVERQRDRGVEFEAVLITGFGDTDSAVRAIELGVYRYLRKPFELDDLLTAVAGAAERLGLRLRLRLMQEVLRQREEEHSHSSAAAGRGETSLLLSRRMALIGKLAVAHAAEMSRAARDVLRDLRDRPTLDSESLARGARNRPPTKQELEEQQHQDMAALLEAQARRAADLEALVSDTGAITSLDLRDAALVAVRLAGPFARQQAELFVDAGGEPLPVRASRSSLVEVVINLLINAAESLVDAADEARQIRVTLGREGTQARLEIADTGCGIPDTEIERAFEPFASTKPHGTGLGLPAVKAAVEAHDGTITVHSRAGGTRFVILLPTSDDDLG